MGRDWLERNWMYAGFVAGLFLLAAAPVFAETLRRPLLLVYLQLPIYMLHQLEEHHRDRFRRWFNDCMAGGRELLTTPAVVLVNIAGVWIVNLIALYLAHFVDFGLGLIAVYLTLVNAVVHVLAALLQRRYNPGLATAVLLFLPLGGYALAVVSAVPGVTAPTHMVALGFVLLLHVAILVHVKRREAALSGT
ncbi:MAG TPA: HXXEE domain-containing protein [Geminicoccaceae bacterium]|nr:HXXEE domain-containing protein [Geminicoccaceae bacterium]